MAGDGRGLLSPINEKTGRRARFEGLEGGALRRMRGTDGSWCEKAKSGARQVLTLAA